MGLGIGELSPQWSAQSEEKAKELARDIANRPGHGVLVKIHDPAAQDTPAVARPP